MTENTTDVGKLIRVYRKIQDKRSELSAQFKEEDEKLVADLDKIKQRLLEYCKETGQDGERIASGFGEVLRVAKRSSGADAKEIRGRSVGDGGARRARGAARFTAQTSSKSKRQIRRRPRGGGGGRAGRRDLN